MTSHWDVNHIELFNLLNGLLSEEAETLTSYNIQYAGYKCENLPLVVTMTKETYYLSHQ